MLRATEIEAGEYLTPQLFVAVEGRGTGSLPGLFVEWENRGGLSWRTTWEPRYLPMRPSLTVEEARQQRVLGTFFFYTRRF
jgi:hypothetical protein